MSEINLQESGSTSESEPEPVKPKIGLTGQILIGLGAGILVGLFFGEACAPLGVLGAAFVGLLQMTALPYIVFALIGGIGRLTAKQSKMLLGRVSLIVLGLWILGLLSVLIVPLALPPQTSASFFSSSSVAEPPAFDFFGLFIPSNPFESLAESKVPAIVVFCILTGIAVIGLRGKDELLRMIGMWQETMSRVTNLIVAMSPAGVFFIAASAAGTMRVEDLGRIQGYLVIFTLITFGFGLGVLPALVSLFTPFRYRDLAPLLRSSFILAFATGKTLAVLPMLIEGTKKIFADKGHDDEETQSIIEVLIPLGYSFPHLGRILTSTYLPFAAWYAGSPLKPGQYVELLGASLFVHFSSATISVPFLLDLLRLPADLFQLFIVIGVLAARLADAAAASYLLVLAVIGASVLIGLFRFQWRRAAVVTVAIVSLTTASVLGVRVFLHKTTGGAQDMAAVVSGMQLQEEEIEWSVVEPGPNPVPLAEGRSRLDRILERGVIRIGYINDSLPFAFNNASGQLVGFDIDLCHDLARDLGVAIEFMSVSSSSDLAPQLKDDYFDLAVGGIADTVDRAKMFRFTEPYLFVNMAVVVEDYRNDEFASIRDMLAIEDLTIGIPGEGWFLAPLREELPNARTVRVGDLSQFFEPTDETEAIDALLFSAEAGSAMTLKYPGFQVATPFSRPISLPLVFPYAAVTDNSWDEFLDNWVMLRRHDGTIDRLFDYWILGEGAVEIEPRWSIVHDVLHWTE